MRTRELRSVMSALGKRSWRKNTRGLTRAQRSARMRQVALQRWNVDNLIQARKT